MKKLLLVFTIAGFAVACNNKSEEKKEETTDTTVVTPPVVDTVKVDTVPVVIDTTKK